MIVPGVNINDLYYDFFSQFDKIVNIADEIAADFRDVDHAIIAVVNLNECSVWLDSRYCSLYDLSYSVIHKITICIISQQLNIIINSPIIF